MKRIGLLFFLIFCTFLLTYAQVDEGVYFIRMNGSVKNGNHSACKAGQQIVLKGGAYEQWLLNAGDELDKGHTKYYGNMDKTISAKNKHTSIWFNGWRGYHEWFECNTKAERNSSIDISGKYPLTNETITHGDNVDYLMSDYECSFQLLIHPNQIKLFYFDSIGGQSNIKQYLPSLDNITLKATKDFPSSVYNWEYKISEENWTPFPTTVTYANNKSEVTFNGQDIFTESKFIQLVDSQFNIQIRINFKTQESADVMTLVPILSAPHIQSTTYESPICHGKNNGEIHIQFDRALYDKERLYFAKKNALTYDITDTITIDPTTKIGVIKDLKADFYDYRLYGSYRFGPLYGDTTSTYTDGINHFDTITVVERPKVVYTISQDSVHCYGGSDGVINIVATGGVGQYYVSLFKVNSTDTIPQTKIFTGTTRFEGLKKGDYKVYLKDLNGCEPQLPDSIYQRISVEEPKRALQTFGTGYQEPIGFGYSDGIIWSNIRGGTGSYTVTWKDSLGNQVKNEVLTPLDTEVGIETRVTGVKKGKYYLYVKDQHHADATPPSYENYCGCEALDSIFVDEPPKLLVTIDTLHYVTCHGDQDGELVAHAIGGRPDHTQLMPYKYDWYQITADSTTILENYSSVNDSILQTLPSAHYVVCVTDTNNIKALSPIFYLTQPDPLVVSTNVIRHLSCSGENNGEMEVIVTGGTKPYSYYWETGDTTRVISGLAKGIYSVFVRDARYLDSQTHYCSEESFGEIESPNGIEITPTIQHPQCNSSADGAIKLTITGGLAPYTYSWSDGVTTKDRTNLQEGNYLITITDSKGCSLTENYTLEEPDPLVVDLGDNFTLCKDRDRTLNGSIGLDNISYLWTCDGKTVSNDSLCTINQPGLYRLTVTNTAGCSAYDEITVNQTADELVSDFVVASKIPNNTKVYAVNIINTGYDRVEWIAPDEAQISENSDERLQFSIADNGFYTIGMIAHKGICQDILYKTIEVTNKGDIEAYDDDEPFLKKFIVSPNPNDGNFKVSIELLEKTDYSLQLYNNQGVLIDTKNIKSSTGEDTLFNGVNAGSGVYYLRFVSKEITSVFKVIIK